MDKGLLAPRGTIVLDNAMMGGHAYMPESPSPNGIAIRNCVEYLQSRDDIFRVSKLVKHYPDGINILALNT